MGLLYVVLALHLLVTTLAASPPTGLYGRVVAVDTGMPLPGATVRVLGTSYATHCDSAGYFAQALQEGTYQLEISYVGYQIGRVVTTVTAAPVLMQLGLAARAIELAETIMVYGARDPNVALDRLKVEKQPIGAEVLAGVEGLGLVRRANYAMTPTVRGGPQRSGWGRHRWNEGIFGLCRPHGSGLFLCRAGKPRAAGDRPGGFRPKGRPGCRRNDQFGHQATQFLHALCLGGQSWVMRRSRAHRFNRSVVNLAQNDLALRGSFSYRRADDFKPGGRPALANTQFAKYNYKIDLAKKGGRHQFGLSLLGDEAWDIGYPALLMDARRAQSRLLSAEHSWKPAVPWLHRARTQVYFSRVDHWMDDERRDVSQRADHGGDAYADVRQDPYLGLVGNPLVVGAGPNVGIGFGCLSAQRLCRDGDAQPRC